MINIIDEKSFEKAFESYEECEAWFDMKDREMRKEEHIRQIKAAADDYA